MDDQRKSITYLQTGETTDHTRSLGVILSLLDTLTPAEREIVRLRLWSLDATNPPTNFIDKRLTTQQERERFHRERDLDMATHIMYKERDIELEITFIFAAVAAGRMANNNRALIRKMLKERAGRLSKAYLHFEEESYKWGQPPHEGNKQSIYTLIQCVRQAVNKKDTQPVIDFVQQYGVNWIRSLTKNWAEPPPHTDESIALAKRFYEIYEAGKAGKTERLTQEQAMIQALEDLGLSTDETDKNYASIDSRIRLCRRVKAKIGF